MDAVVTEYLRAKAGALRRHEDALRENVPGSVHKARIATRKLRSTLRVFAADSPEADALQRRLRDWGHLLGAARDAEVTRALLRDRTRRVTGDDAYDNASDDAEREAIAADDGAAGDAPDRRDSRSADDATTSAPTVRAVRALAGHLDRRLAEEYERARLDVVGQLDTPEHAALLTELDELIGGGARDGAGDGDGDGNGEESTPRGSRAKALVAAAKAARKKYKKRRHQAEQLSGPDADAAWHRARRAAKRARYAAELVADTVPGKPGRKARKKAKRLKKVQSHLGTHQDEVTLRTWLERQRQAAADADENLAPYDALLR